MLYSIVLVTKLFNVLIVDSVNLLKTGSMFSFRRLKYMIYERNNEILMSVASGDDFRG
jgi:hypothetical protein